MTARPHTPVDTEVMRNNESYWSGLTNCECQLGHTKLIACFSDRPARNNDLGGGIKKKNNK